MRPSHLIVEIGQSLGLHLGTEAMLAHTHALITAHMGIPVSILAAEPRTNRLAFKASSTMGLDAQSEFLEHVAPGLLQQLGAAGSQYLAPDIARDPLMTPALKQLFQGLSGLALPIHSGTELVGLLLAGKPVTAPFSEEELELLEAVAAELGLALKNAALWQEQQRALSQASLLLELTNLLASPKSLPEVLETTCRAVKERLKFECTITLLDPTTGYLIGRASSHFSPEQLQQIRAAPGRSPIFKALTDGYYHIPRLGSEEKAPAFARENPELAEMGQLTVGIQHAGTHLGVLLLTGFELREVHSETLQLCRGVGQQVGLAVHNAQVLDRLQVQAMTDELTGLGNHRQFQDSLSGLIASGNRVSLIFSDIDHFKRFNDRYGHQEGDRVLRAVAGAMREVAGAEAVPCRYGGEEFAIILPGEPGRARLVAEVIRQKITTEVALALGLRPGALTVSAGVATYPDHAQTKDGLIALADLALYEAKARGRNRVLTHRSGTAVYRGSVSRQEQHVVPTLKTLMALIRAKDRYTYGHCTRVARLASLVAREMQLPEDEVRVIEHGAFLHDIGKLEISRETLTKPDRLSDSEWAIMRQHPSWGADLLLPIPLLRDAIPVVLWHHERWDGTGYPDGLAGEKIPLAARIVAVADSVDAMTHIRAYQRAKTAPEVHRELQTCAGSQFDPQVVEAYFRAIQRLRPIAGAEASEEAPVSLRRARSRRQPQ